MNRGLGHVVGHCSSLSCSGWIWQSAIADARALRGRRAGSSAQVAARGQQRAGFARPASDRAGGR